MDVGPLFIDFWPQHPKGEVAQIYKQLRTNAKFNGFSIPWLLCCWVDLLIDFWLIFGGCGGRKPTKNQPKSHPKSDPKQDAILDASWMALGATFGGFWLQVGGQVEAKLAPKSNKIGHQDDSKKQHPNR